MRRGRASDGRRDGRAPPAGGPPPDDRRAGAARVSKSFGAVQALYEVDFHVAPGEVMALVGDNGAGKSTLIKCIAGIHPVDERRGHLRRQPVNIHGPKDAAGLGIEVVYQDLALADNLDVVQNMFLGREETGAAAAARRDEDGEAGVGDADGPVRHHHPLRAPDRRGAVRRPAPVRRGRQGRDVELALVILDEPTAALGVAQTKQVLDLVKRLGEQGLAVVLISHNLHDIFQVADSITVLRLGRTWRSSSARGPTSRRSSRRSPPGSSRRCPASRGGRRMSAATPAARRRPSDAPATTTIGAYAQRWWTDVKSGELGSLPIIVGLIIIAIVFQTQNDRFLTAGNFVNLIVQTAPYAVIAMGVTFALLLGEIDLSIGFVSGVGGVLTAILLTPDGNELPTWVVIVIVIGAGARSAPSTG